MNQFFQNISEAVIRHGMTALGTWLVTVGILGDGNKANFITTMSGVLIAAASQGWVAWSNRSKAIIQKAAAQPETVVVTSPEIAHDTPEGNIVSGEANKVVPRGPLMPI